jgi:PAS domain S-box-containing protein
MRGWMKRLTALLDRNQGLPIEDMGYDVIAAAIAVLCLGFVLPINWFQNLPGFINASDVALGLLALLLYKLARRGRRYPVLLFLATLVVLDGIYFPNAGSRGSISFYFVALVAVPLAILRGLRRWLFVGLLLLNHVGLILADHLWPGLATPFERPVDRVVDLAAGAVCASLALATAIWLVMAVHAQKHQLLRTLSARLAASERGYRDLVESSSTAIFRVALSGRIDYCNRFAEDVLGIARQEVLGRDFVDTIAPNEHAPAPATREALRALLSDPGVAAAVETCLVNRRGEAPWISWTSQPIHDDVQRLSAVLCIGSDISEHKRVEEERRRYSAHLTQMQKLESVGFLAGGIAHDFNNYLTGILANVSLLKESLDATSETHAIATAVETASLQARGLTKQLLTFAKGGAPVRTRVNIADSLKTAVSLTLRGTSTTADIEVVEPCPAILADEAQLGQVLNNLLINAHQAMPSGGTVTIRATDESLPANNVHALPPGRYVRVTFTDTGAGIAKEHLDKIFDPYFTTKSAGSGLGLAVVFSIMRQHGGSVSAVSERGKGATFTLLLPATERSAIPTPTPLTQRIPRDERILIMDDEDMVRVTASRLLAKLGYTTSAASHGQEAVAMYEEALAVGRPYSAVIVDLTIPGGMGGREAVQRLRAIDPNVKALVSSGYSDDPVVADYQSHGFTGVVSKPYTLAEMRRALSKALSDKSNG